MLARAADPAVIEAARQEGALAVADAAPGENFQKFMAAFKAKYSFLDIATGFYSAPTGRVLARVNAEIDAKRLSFDVMLAANTAAWIEMTQQGRIARYRFSGICRFSDRREERRLLGRRAGDRRHPCLQQEHVARRAHADILERSAAPGAG